MPRTLVIPSKPAILALGKFVGQINRADLRDLKRRLTKMGKKPKGKIRTAAQWVRLLERALVEIREWCPSGPFEFDLPPKPSRRRGRARR